MECGLLDEHAILVYKKQENIYEKTSRCVLGWNDIQIAGSQLERCIVMEQNLPVMIWALSRQNLSSGYRLSKFQTSLLRDLARKWSLYLFYVLLYVTFFHSSFAVILMGKRQLVALFSLSSWCLLMVGSSSQCHRFVCGL